MVQAYILLSKATAILHASVSWVRIHKVNIHTLSEGTEENHEKTSVRIAGLWLKISIKEL
jgi:hypothetical protein